MSVAPRLRRLFAADGKCVDVAIDHGLFNEVSFLQGIADIDQAIELVVGGGPDAIQLSAGQAPKLQSLPGPKPALVLRVDVANVYGSTVPLHVFSQLLESAVRQAVQLDAASVVVNLLLLPGQPKLHRDCVDNVLRLKADCQEYGMPLMVEPLVMRPNEQAGGYMVDGNTDKIVALVRQAVELGADIIKSDPTDDLDDFPRVVEAAGGRPVLPRGGGRTTPAEILTRSYQLIKHGAAGIVYGRNILQHSNPTSMTRALLQIVHHGATPNEALEQLTNSLGNVSGVR